MAGLEELLNTETCWGFDTETTGLEWFKEDSIFAMSISCKDRVFYYDLRKDSPDVMKTVMSRVLGDDKKTVFIHNAKFDMHFAKKFFPKLEFRAKIYDTEMLARVWKNDMLSYSLDSVAKLFGYEKADAVKDWIKKNKAYRKVQLSLGEEKVPEYNKVPIEIMEVYAKKDAEIALNIGKRLLVSIAQENDKRLSKYNKSLFDIVELERQVTLALFHVEHLGVMLDVEYTKEMFAKGKAEVDALDKELLALCGPEFKDSAKFLKDILEKYPNDLAKTPRTATGLLQLTDEVLSTHENPVSALIRKRRERYKQVGTYYSSFLDLVDEAGYIHTNFRQTGASTFRMSCSNPNLQNIPKNEDDPTHGMEIRRCFIPPKGYLWTSIDYKQQELRIIFDVAGQQDLITEILAGKDAHQATADLVGCSRKEAKGLNFAIAYGAGIAQITTMLDKPSLTKDLLQALYFDWRGLSLSKEQKEALAKISEEEKDANILLLEKYQKLRDDYFAGMPKVRDFNKAISDKAKNTGWICNSFGAIYQLEKDYSYKALNCFVQGSSAHVTKKALVGCYNILKGMRSRVVLIIHDEICFYIHKEEMFLLDEIKEVMRAAYACKSLPMDVDVSTSEKSWGDLE